MDWNTLHGRVADDGKCYDTATGANEDDCTDAVDPVVDAEAVAEATSDADAAALSAGAFCPLASLCSFSPSVSKGVPVCNVSDTGAAGSASL